MADQLLVGTKWVDSVEEILAIIRHQGVRATEGDIDGLGNPFQEDHAIFSKRPDLRVAALIALSDDRDNITDYQNCRQHSPASDKSALHGGDAEFAHYRATITLSELVKNNRKGEAAFIDDAVVGSFLRSLQKGHPYAAKAAAEGLGALAKNRPELIEARGGEVVAALVEVVKSNTHANPRMTYKHAVYDAAIQAILSIKEQAQLTPFMTGEAYDLVESPLPPGRRPKDGWEISPPMR